MSNWQLRAPVAFLIFNRPDTTEQVFIEIAKAKPQKLLVVADGPRADHPEDAKKCAASRAIIERVDWDCEVQTNYSDVNLGCKRRVSSGLAWVFENVEKAIILEDDCLPDPTFFRFCDELLEFYSDNDKIMHISGTNLIPHFNINSSFLFSRLVPIWGWATWKRAWKYFDLNMKLWPDYKNTDDIDYFRSQKDNVLNDFEKNYCGRIDTWDAQWAFSCVANNGYSIIPHKNLIRNIGFRQDAAHTKQSNILTSITVEKIQFPLKKPFCAVLNRDFDEEYLKLLNGNNNNSGSLDKLRSFMNMFKRLE